MTPNDRISEIRAGFTKILDGLTEVRQGVHGLEGDLLDWAESSVDVGTYQLSTVTETPAEPEAPEETASPWSETAEAPPAPEIVPETPAEEAQQPEADEAPKEEAPAEDPTPEPEPAPEPEAADPEATLEQVRAKLADLSRAGHTDHVRQLIHDTGATKLSEVPETKFAALLAAAEKITA